MGLLLPSQLLHTVVSHNWVAFCFQKNALKCNVFIWTDFVKTNYILNIVCRRQFAVFRMSSTHFSDLCLLCFNSLRICVHCEPCTCILRDTHFKPQFTRSMLTESLIQKSLTINIRAHRYSFTGLTRVSIRGFLADGHCSVSVAASLYATRACTCGAIMRHGK